MYLKKKLMIRNCSYYQMQLHVVYNKTYLNLKISPNYLHVTIL